MEERPEIGGGFLRGLLAMFILSSSFAWTPGYLKLQSACNSAGPPKRIYHRPADGIATATAAAVLRPGAAQSAGYDLELKTQSTWSGAAAAAAAAWPGHRFK